MQPRALLVASEAIPLVKTGGLADVITALACELKRNHVDVSILLPGYPCALDAAENLKEAGYLPDLPGGPGKLYQGTIAEYDDVSVLLLDTPNFRKRLVNPYVDHDGNEYQDNAASFAALSHAAVAICAGKTSVPVPHVVHANDWHAGLIPALLHVAGIQRVGTVLTIHNLAFQGNYPMDLAESLGLPESLLGPDGMEFWGKMSFLKAGIRYADRISTVSESYAKEILTPRFGCGLDGILNERKDAIVPIPNGIDINTWDPETDPMIKHRFSRKDLRHKSTCKQELQKLFKLQSLADAPLMALGSRITHQKMADLALESLPGLLEKHPRLQVAVLGCGDHEYEHGFAELAKRYPGRVGVHIGYDEQRAHALHAGADMLLHGTRFEPFGLTPIYSMRYGTIPVASRVGGIIDTIPDAGLNGTPPQGACGVLFDGETADAMGAAVDRAIALYEQPAVWLEMQRHSMSCDFSWNGPVRKYIDMYRQVAPQSVRHLFAAALVQPVEDYAELPVYTAAA
ncbi:MAG: glgA [Paucimonas sp.]|nr:glgA [Paucimonas sp.]